VGTARLARRLATILPAMTLAEGQETTRIYCVAGLTGGRTAVVTTRPFWAPHHMIFALGVIGGGPRPLPREGFLAHHGILFLDERPAYTRHVLEVLRQLLEEGLLYQLLRAYRRRRDPGRARRTGTDTDGRT
jgi:magnesium chelatase family protein